MKAMTYAIQLRDAELDIHVRGVADLACATAMQLGLSDEGTRMTRETALLHDVGKAAIPDKILSKPGMLDDAEWSVMKRHTIIGERMVSATLAPVARLVRSTHERFDGYGYPDGLAGDDIPLISRIVAVCDAYDAIVTGRPYREARDPATAIAELRKCSGTQFDPEIVEACVYVLDEETRSDVAPAIFELVQKGDFSGSSPVRGMVLSAAGADGDFAGEGAASRYAA